MSNNAVDVVAATVVAAVIDVVGHGCTFIFIFAHWLPRTRCHAIAYFICVYACVYVWGW